MGINSDGNQVWMYHHEVEEIDLSEEILLLAGKEG